VRLLLPWPVLAVGCQVHQIDWWRSHWSAVAAEHDVDISPTEAERLITEAERLIIIEDTP